MLSVLVSAKQDVRKLLLLGGVYIFSVLVVYFLAGLGLMYFFASFPLALTEYISIGVGLFIVAAGLMEIKDYLWYGKGFSLYILPFLSKKLHNYSINSTIPGVIRLGAFVSAVELPCTGAPYRAV